MHVIPEAALNAHRPHAVMVMHDAFRASVYAFRPSPCTLLRIRLMRTFR